MRLTVFAAFFAMMASGSACFAEADAIAFANNGAFGYGTNHPSRAAAERTAMKFCRSNGGTGCRIVAWTTNSCLAMSLGNRSGYGVGWSNDATAAVNRASQECRKRTSGCKLLVNTCQ